jgi:hypothetical protein
MAAVPLPPGTAKKIPHPVFRVAQGDSIVMLAGLHGRRDPKRMRERAAS